MPDFELAIISVDVDHVMGSRHDDPRHGTAMEVPKVLSTPKHLDTCFNTCDLTETNDGDLHIFQSVSYQSTLKPGEILYVDTGFRFASNKAKYYRITAI